jgi:hypothetical protein
VRLGVRAEVNESANVTIRLATASSAISTNQTLGDPADPGMARRGFGLDLAYLDWIFLRHGKILGGRTANPFWSPAKNQLVFDSDLSFEGVAAKWEPKWSSSGAFINLGAFIISENYSGKEDVVDSGLVGGQAGYSRKAGDLTWTVHFATYHYLNIQNRPITSLDKDAKIDPYSYPFDRYRGNTAYVNDPLLPANERRYFFQNQYVLIEAGTEVKQKWREFEFLTFFNYVCNDRVSRQNIGKEYGLTTKWRKFSISAAGIAKASDSVVAAFSDSDSNGGGTDNSGTRYQLSAQLSQNAQVALTRYKAKRGLDSIKRDFDSTHIDFIASF